jgi:hypothetical protein
MKYRDVIVDGYIWVKELQKRGVVHYHMIFLTPQRIRDFYNKVNESWGYGFVFVRGVEKRKVKSTIFYIMKYIKKDINKGVENDKMRRRVGRGGILRFKCETFVGRVVKFSEFEFVGSAYTKGMGVKVYRFKNMVMLVSTSMYGVRFDIFECDVDKIVEQFKYMTDNGLASMLNDLKYLFLSKVERQDIIGYNIFDRELNNLIYGRRCYCETC